MNRNSMRFAGLVLFLVMASDAQAGWLGQADSFGVLGGTTVTNTGLTVIVGNLGVSPGTSITGFPPGTVMGGSIHANDSTAIQAHADASVAYAMIAGLAVTTDLSGRDLGGLTLTPGVYHFGSSAQLTGKLTLDAQGQANAQFIFQIGTTLTTASVSSILAINDAQANNIFFQVGDSATLGVGTSFVGTILASNSETLSAGANVNGRIIALGGAVTLDTNQITAPSTVPEPSSILLLGIATTIGLALAKIRQPTKGGQEPKAL